MKDFLEWFCGWMKQWLQYSKWYYMVALDPSVSLEAFFKAPVVNTNWNCDRKIDLHLLRFGLVWKLYDMVTLKGLVPRYFVLTHEHSALRGTFGLLLQALVP